MEISQTLRAPPRSSGSAPENTSKTEVTTNNQWNFSKDCHTFNSTAPSQHSDYQIGFKHFTDYFKDKFVKELKEYNEVISCKSVENSLESLKVVDAILRLGIEYHFQEEIEAILQWQYNMLIDGNYQCCHDDLYLVALRFRLLRQQGYHVSADVFKRFEDKKGKFRPEISTDVNGLMEIFETSQVIIAKDCILNEAEDFSSHYLNMWVERLDYHTSESVLNTLDQPFHKSLAKLNAKRFLQHNLEGSNGWLTILQEFFKLDLEIVQSIYQKEILEVSKWWRDLGLAKELEFARDQPIKWYLWTVATLTDPRWSGQRVDLSKPISLVYIIDDIFDVYGALNELTLFTEAVNKWDLDMTKKLPNYMVTCFKALDDITKEIGNKVYKKHGWNPIDSLKKAWIKLCNAFLKEAKWFASGYLPTTEEYLKSSMVSTGVHVVLVHIFFLLGEGINKQVVDHVDQVTGIISSVATILRLWDDLGNALDEDQNGHDGSYVQCYMKENKGSSMKEAREHVNNKINEAWKGLNEECLSSNPFPASFKRACLNAARMVPLMYNYDNNHRLPRLEDYFKSLM